MKSRNKSVLFARGQWKKLYIEDTLLFFVSFSTVSRKPQLKKRTDLVLP